jgi:hypothetical protein
MSSATLGASASLRQGRGTMAGLFYRVFWLTRDEAEQFRTAIPAE